MSTNKITFTVVCDEIGKKYKISFKEEIYHMISIKHVRDHLRKAQSKSYSFELYYNGELLLDPMLCIQQNITNNSVVLMCLIKTPQLLNGQLTQRYQATSPKHESFSGINRGSLLMGAQHQYMNQGPMQAATALKAMQQINNIEDKSDYKEIDEFEGMHNDEYDQYGNEDVIDMQQNYKQNTQNMQQRQQYKHSNLYSVQNNDDEHSDMQLPMLPNMNIQNQNDASQANSPQISQINVRRSINNNDVRVNTTHKFISGKQQKMSHPQPQMEEDEYEDAFQQINVLSVKPNISSIQQTVKHAHMDPPNMLLSRRPANNIFASSAHYDTAESQVDEQQNNQHDMDKQNQYHNVNPYNNTAKTDQQRNQINSLMPSQMSNLQTQTKQVEIQNMENEKIRKLESQVELLQKQLQENQQNVSLLVKQQVDEILKSQLPRQSDQFSVVNDLVAQKEKLINLQQQLANNANVQTSKTGNTSNPFSTAINADISDINTPILPSFNVRPAQTPLELLPTGNQAQYESVQQNIKQQQQNYSSRNNGQQMQIQNQQQYTQQQIDLDQYQGQPSPAISPAHQLVSEKNNDVLQNEQQYQEEQRRIDLEEEIENLGKVLSLLQNEREIMETDRANQAQLNATQMEQLQQQKRQVDQGAYMAAKADAIRREIMKLQQRLDQSAETRRNLHNQIEDLKGNIRVFVRVRPQSIEEKPKNQRFPSALNILDQQTIKLLTGVSADALMQNVGADIQTGSVGQLYKFYRVYKDDTQQQQVFNDVKPVLRSALDGYNVFIGGYGSTGSGKTYTILGDEGNDNLDGTEAKYPTFSNDSVGYERLGILPRAVVELFYRLQLTMQNPHVDISMLELYCDTMIDLLNEDETFEQPQLQQQWVSGTSTVNQSQFNLKSKLEIKQGSGHPYVRGLRRVSAGSADDAVSILGRGLARRHVAATAMNGRSSRSHTLVYIYLPCGSTVLFADLAGSERLERTGSEGQRQREAQAINQSLSALGDVMAALSGRRAHVPYRNSRLTQLLQPGFGGTSKALLFICLAPLDSCIQEAFCSLQFGTRAKAVQNVNIKGLLG